MWASVRGTCSADAVGHSVCNRRCGRRAPGCGGDVDDVGTRHRLGDDLGRDHAGRRISAELTRGVCRDALDMASHATV